MQTALRCPKLFHFRYVDKIKEPEVMPDARIGKAVHKALEFALQGMGLDEALQAGRKDLPDEDEARRYDRICENIPHYLMRVDAFRDRKRVGRQYVEFRLAIREDGSSTAFFAKDALVRGILDVMYSYDGDQLALVDHKSGRRHPHASIREQLQGYAVLASAYLQRARSLHLGVHWVADSIVEWIAPISKSEVDERLRPMLLSNVEAASLAVVDGPRAQTSSWCERCSYRSMCPEGQAWRFEPVDEEPDPGIY